MKRIIVTLAIIAASLSQAQPIIDRVEDLDLGVASPSFLGVRRITVRATHNPLGRVIEGGPYSGRYYSGSVTLAQNYFNGEQLMWSDFATGALVNDVNYLNGSSYFYLTGMVDLYAYFGEERFDEVINECEVDFTVVQQSRYRVQGRVGDSRKRYGQAQIRVRDVSVALYNYSLPDPICSVSVHDQHSSFDQVVTLPPGLYTLKGMVRLKVDNLWSLTQISGATLTGTAIGSFTRL